MIPPASHRIPRVRWYSRSTARVFSLLPTGLSPPMAALSRDLRLGKGFLTLCPVLGRDCYALQHPESVSPKPTLLSRFGLFPVRSPLLGESLLISLPQGTKMFQFPWFPLTGLCVQPGGPRFCRGGFPHSGIHGYKLARQPPVAYRSLATPFLGPWHQGIHRAPLVA